MADILKKVGQCCCYSQGTCNCACFVDCWWAAEAQGLCNLYCCAGCWTIFSPLCIECKMGDCDKGIKQWVKAFKYCGFSCLTSCVAPCDGLYSCFKTIMGAFQDGGIKQFDKDVKPNFCLLSEKVKTFMELEVGEQPLKSFSTFTP